jgi:tetratricopeptide (TPR) repeat protein
VPAAAVELFVERARAAGPGFVPTTAVGDVVRALDHLPLAIELAAARTRLLDLDQLAARLDDALGLLTAGPRDAPERHRTLRGAIEWSHALLAPEEQAVFRRLAVFAGPFTLEEAEAVAGDRTGLGDLELLDLLDRLVRASMVTVEDGADGHRFRLLETVRQFAAEQLIASAEEPLVRRRHFDVFAERPPDRDDTNARAALAWALEAGDEVVGALELAHKLATGWYVHGALSEGRRWLEAALAAGAGRAPSDLLSRVELARANICYGQGDMNAAEAAFEAAAEHGEPAVVARAHFGLGNLAVLRGDPSASTLLEEAAIAAERLDDDDLMMRVANSLGMVARRAGDFAAARDHAETGLRAARRLGDRVAVATVLINLANLHQALERPDEARDRLEEALVLSRQEGFTRGVASALGSLGVITDDPDEARAYLEESLELARAPGDRQVVAVTLANLGRVRLKGGDIGAARISFEEYRAVSEQLGDRRGVAQAGRSLADVARRAGDFEGAARDGAEALRLHLEIGDQDRLVEALEVVAAVLAVTGRVEVAGDVLAACDRARVDMSMPRDAEDDDVRAVIVAAAGEPTTRDAPSVGDATKAALTALGD